MWGSMRKWVWSLMLPVCLALAACGSPWKKPEVSLSDVQFAGGTLFEQRLKLKLRVYNPNDREIPLEALSFQFVAGDKRFASGQTTRAVRIPAQGESLIELEASMQLASLLRQLPQLTGGDGKLRYRLRGSAVVEGYGGVPFDHPGELDIGTIEEMVRKKAGLLMQ